MADNADCINSACNVFGLCGGDNAVCSDNDQCIGTCIAGRCSDPSSITGACDANDDDDCTGELQCDATGNCGGNGASCTDNAQCDNTCVAGFCSNAGVLGQSCDASDDDDCGGALQCSTGGVCGGDDAGCTSNGECLNVCIAGSCGVRAGIGGACDAGEAADCSGGVACSDDGVCGGDGADCNTNGGCVDVCIGDACQPQSGPGGTCDPSDDADCHSGASCSAAGVCGGAGSACTSNAECGDVCIDGFCSAAAALGGTCDASEDADCTGNVACSASGTCGGEGSACDINDECVKTCVEGSCAPVSGTDSACDDDADCAGSIQCSDAGSCGGQGAGCAENSECSEQCIADTCAPAAAIGEACDAGDDDDCNASTCNPDGMCGGDGSACNGNAECLNTCVNNVCALPSGAGGQCDPADGNADCGGGLDCSAAGICGGSGATCSNNSQCTDTCISGSCAAPVIMGANCDPEDDDDCAGDLQCSNDGICGGNGAGCEQNTECLVTCIAGSCSEISDATGTCDDADDCLGDVQCNPDGNCGGSGAGCVENADCDDTCIAGVCTEPVNVGDACDLSDSDDCSGTSQCSAEGTCGGDTAGCAQNADCLGTCLAGSCTPISVLGQECDIDDDDDCTQDVSCNVDGLCGGEGAPCSANAECDDVCISGACALQSAPGGVCDPEDNDDCGQGALCTVDGVCGGAGTACEENSECEDACIDGFCAPLAAIGGRCDSLEDADCEGTIRCGNAGTCGGTGGGCQSNAECVGTCIAELCADPVDLTGACDANDDADCAGELQCNPDGDCGGNGAGCFENADCHGSCINGICVEAATPGGVCDAEDDDDCQGTIRCNAEGTCGGQDAGCASNSDCLATCRGEICAVSAAIGETCDVGDADDCTGNASCNPEGRCGGDGALCDLNTDCENVCIEGQCAQPNGPGGVCDALDNDDCSAGAMCTSEGVCGGAGTTCTADDACEEVCIAGFCASTAPLGGNCDAQQDADCQPPTRCSEAGICGGNASLCADNGQCVGSCFAGSCKDPGPVGDDCDPGEARDCAGAVECSADGLCGGQGVSCEDNSECLATCIDTTCSRRAALGEDCDVGDVGDCADNVGCDDQGVCGGAGAACSANADCIEVCIDGACSAPSQPGGACDMNDHEDCSDGAACTDDGVCGGAGTPCASNNECLDACVGGFCQLPAEIGGVCDPEDSADCVADVLCSQEGTCGGVGVTCDDNTTCNGTCVAGTCSDLMTLGGTCDDEDDCIGSAQCGEDNACGGNGASCNDNDACVAACVNSRCAPLAEAGEACDDDADCTAGVCTPDAVCGDSSTEVDAGVEAGSRPDTGTPFNPGASMDAGLAANDGGFDDDDGADDDNGSVRVRAADDGGCGCRVPSPSSGAFQPGYSVLAWLMLGLTLAGRRRRRTGPSSKR